MRHWTKTHLQNKELHSVERFAVNNITFLFPSPLLHRQQHLLPLHVILPRLLRQPGSTLGVWSHFVCRRLPVCRRLCYEWGDLCAICTVWLHLPKQILPCKWPSVTRVTVYLCDHVTMCAHISPSFSSKRSLWPRTALSLVSVAVPVLCVSRRPARTLTCAPSTTSNVTATKVRVHASVWALCILNHTIIQQGCVGESGCWTGLCAVQADNIKAKIQQRKSRTMEHL